MGYASMASWATSIDIPPYLAGDIRFSMDFDPIVSGATFYNAVRPEGVIVDGAHDSVPSSPLSKWIQLSTDGGTLIQVADPAPIGGTAYNHYEDDITVDEKDTGDLMRFGDAGIYIANPNLAFDYPFSIYFLDGKQPNLGDTYAAFFEHPLGIQTQLFGNPLPERVYCPLILRNSR